MVNKASKSHWNFLTFSHDLSVGWSICKNKTNGTTPLGQASSLFSGPSYSRYYSLKPLNPFITFYISVIVLSISSHLRIIAYINSKWAIKSGNPPVSFFTFSEDQFHIHCDERICATDLSFSTCWHRYQLHYIAAGQWYISMGFIIFSYICWPSNISSNSAFCFAPRILLFFCD